MAERVPIGGSLRVPLKAYLSIDHTSEAMGQTVFVQISKNMGAFSNPAIGTYGATEMSGLSYGWYWIDLGPSDFNVPGPMIVRGTVSNGDPTEITLRVDPFPLEANVQLWKGGSVPSTNISGVPIVDHSYALGVLSPAQAGYMALDWSAITNKTATVALPNTTIGNVSGTAPSDVRLWKGGLVPTPPITGVPITDPQYGKGTVIPGKPGYFPIDWGQVANPTTVLALSNTTISTIQQISSIMGTIDANIQQWNRQNVPTTGVSGIPIVDTQYTKGTFLTTKPGYVGIDWSNVANPTASNALTNTTISATQTVASVSGSVQSYNNDKTGYSLTAAYDLAKTAAQTGDAMRFSTGSGAGQLLGVGGSVPALNIPGVDKTGYSLTVAYDAAKTAAQPGDRMKLHANAMDILGPAPDIADDATGRASYLGQQRMLLNRFYEKVTQDGTEEKVHNESGDVVSTMPVSKTNGVATKDRSS